MQAYVDSSRAIRRRGAMPRLSAVICLLTALCEGFDVQTAGVAASGLARELHCTPADLGLFFSSSGLGLLLGSVLGGRIADQHGRKHVLVTSVLLFGASSFLTAYMPILSLLTVARFFTGLGLGGALPNLIALAAEGSVPGAHSRNIGIAYVGMPIGGALASVLSFFIPTEAWRDLFLVGGLTPLVIVPALIIFLPGGRRVATNAVVSDLTVCRPSEALFGKGRAAKTLSLWLSFFLIVLTLHLMLNWLPFLLSSRGLDKDSAMLAQAAFGIGGACLALCQSALLDSPLRKASVLVGIVALPLVLACMAVAPASPVTLIPLAMLLGGAILVQQVLAYVAGSVYYPDSVRATGLGAAIAAGRVGSLAGPLFAAALLASGRTAGQVLVGVVPIVLACGASVAVIARLSPPIPNRQHLLPLPWAGLLRNK